jgi:hypothetical protein
MVNTTLPLLLKTRKLWLLFRPGQCPEPLLILQIFKSTGTRESGHCIAAPEQLGISFSCMRSHAKHGNDRTIESLQIVLTTITTFSPPLSNWESVPAQVTGWALFFPALI